MSTRNKVQNKQATSYAARLFSRLPLLFKKSFPILLVTLTYIAFTFYYMTPSFLSCGDTLYGFGDNTAGPIWRNQVSPNSPLWGYQTVSNYPVGENLYSPVNYSASLQYTLYWGMAKVAGPVCGYNLVNIVGFVTAALVMYGFIFSLTKKHWIAWVAGFAVSFTPYFQMKVGGHPGYGFQALLIGTVWAFYNLLKKQRRRDSVYLAILTAACFYLDPYFSLLVVACLGPLYLVWGALAWHRVRCKILKKSVVIRQLQVLALSIVATIIFLAPLIVVTIMNAKEISSSVAAARGNVLFEAQACSNLPHEYTLPFVLHPIFSRLFGKENYVGLVNSLHDGFSCGIGEDTVGISLVVLTIVSVGLIILCWEKINKRRLKMSLGYDQQLVILGLFAIGLAAFVMALPPIKVGGVPTPSYLLLMVTSTWRTLTRLYVLVNFASITLFSIFLLYVAQSFREYRKWLYVCFSLAFFLIFIEYQAFRPFVGNKLSTFSYKTDVPTAYRWLRDQDQIKTIAEYPLERAGGESNAAAFYFSMQPVHKKNLFNGNNATSYEENLKGSLKDLSDPQTLAVLNTIGVDAVIIHGVNREEVEKIQGLEVLFSAPQSKFNLLAYTPLVTNDTIVVARIKDMPNVKVMAALGEGFVRNTNIIKSAIDWEYEALNGSVINIVPIPGGKDGNGTVPHDLCFLVRSSGENDSANIVLDVDGARTQPLPLNAEYQHFKVKVTKSIILTNDKGFNMRVKDLGCSPEEL